MSTSGLAIAQAGNRFQNRMQSSNVRTASCCLVEVYLTTLEAVKDMVRQNCERRGMGAAETAAIASSVGGGVASLATQSVVVPVDVVSLPASTACQKSGRIEQTVC